MYNACSSVIGFFRRVNLPAAYIFSPTMNQHCNSSLTTTDQAYHLIEREIGLLIHEGDDEDQDEWAFQFASWIEMVDGNIFSCRSC
jgi:hypothetical protein